MENVGTLFQLVAIRVVMLVMLTNMPSAYAQNPDVKTLPTKQSSVNASPLDQYAAEMRKKIKQVWAPRKDAEDSTVVVAFKITKEGI